MTSDDVISPIESYTRARAHTHGTSCIEKMTSSDVMMSPHTLSALAARVSRLGHDRRGDASWKAWGGISRG